MTPLKAIRAKCLDCMGGQVKEVRLCPIPECPLYLFRLGKNPNIKRDYTEAERMAIRSRLSKITPEIMEDNGVD